MDKFVDRIFTWIGNKWGKYLKSLGIEETSILSFLLAMHVIMWVVIGYMFVAAIFLEFFDWAF